MDATLDGHSLDVGPRDTARPDAVVPEDTGPLPDACVDGGVETCNHLDDDCDGMIDEGVDTQRDPDNCGACGSRCTPAHAFAHCTAGTCGFSTCDTGYYDLDHDPANGCEYRCAMTAADDTRCDLRDNDCDGIVDEDVHFDTDPVNCGSCGRACRFSHASGACTGSVCVLGTCDVGFHDADGSPLNGCELSCVEAVPAVEVCNLRDDDCDSRIDEGDPGSGASCGSSAGQCRQGVEHCIGGAISCTGGVSPIPERCNGLDDNCDGVTDEGNPGAGRTCGTGTGACVPGREQCTSGALVCTGAIGPAVESCNGLDDDCDGTIDNGDPGGGGSCGSAVGHCIAGVQHCRGGVIACEGATGPAMETCNAIDDDCDGVVDQGNPGGGGACGSSVGTCRPGINTCTSGALICTGSSGATPEVCDALDNNCDGRVDEGNPGGGAACGSAIGACRPGMQVCTAGAFVCTGALGPRAETCNGVDDDCDGTIDQGNPGGGGLCGSGVGRCVPGSQVCSGGTLVCTGGTGPIAEACNGLDDNCDGSVDEGNPGGGGTCGSNVGACRFGAVVCAGGALTCSGGTGPSPEICDGIDNNCDGRIDEGNPGGGGTCGSAIGSCRPGMTVCTAGALVCMGGTGPAAEVCDSLDNNCNGSVDEGNPGGGGTCGSNVGACRFGALTCSGGAITCVGGTGPSAETCNGIDDDCDGAIDQGNPGGGSACGSDVGTCRTGARTCSGGALTCVGGTGPVAEVCDALDNNCNGSIDEGNPGGGAACGSAVGTCRQGSTVCGGGSFSCSGATGPTAEVCDGLDNDCNGVVDNGFSLATDVNNCGMCGRVCVVPHAVPRCSGGACGVLVCQAGFVDLDGNPVNGCEYACSVTGPEACNGADDNCNGMIDEGLTAPSMFCNPNGVCAGTTPTCAGAGGWVCNYPPATYQAVETRCDGLDNNCNGAVDEPYPLKGTACNNGLLGACRTVGMYICNGAQNGVTCNAPAGPAPTAELCNGIDDDCNGTLDNGAPVNWINFVSGGAATQVMQYEVSRPDATSLVTGVMSHRACSEPNRVPWTQVTYPQAQAACATVGARLCTETEWQSACRSSTAACTWSYSAACSTYAPNTCNGNDFDTDPVTAGDQDAVRATMSMPMCYSSWPGGRVFDMSGNVREWAQARAAGVNPLRGGSTLDTAGGIACTFSFSVASDVFQENILGFRCCR